VIQLPARLTRGRLELRLWRASDYPGFVEVVGTDRERLLPWLPWVSDEPRSREEWRDFVHAERVRFAAGRNATYGTFLGSAVAGGCGLHQRGPAGTLHIGYWVAGWTLRRGVATTAAALLVEAAFTAGPHAAAVVEIHHDPMNHASAAVARRLGFRLLPEADDRGHRIWRLAREELTEGLRQSWALRQVS
jgi:RimJ/RimL family protein N-acetyltransferase